LLPALDHVIEKIAAFSETRPASLVLITDGEVGNEEAILKRLAARPSLRVHVFGIDVTINDGFLNQLAARHHGTSCLLAPTDDIVGAVARLGDRLRRPVFTSLRAPKGWELPGADLPDLHAGEVLSLPLRKQGMDHRGATDEAPSRELVVEGKLADGSSRQLRFYLARSPSPAIPLVWARRRIELLLAQGQPAAAISLARENNLVCEGAAFIAWDEAEKVAVSTREIYQPAMVVARSCCMPPAPAGEMLSEMCQPVIHEEGLFRAPKAKKSFFDLLTPRARKPMPPSGPEDVNSRVRMWRTEMEQHVLLQTLFGGQFLDCLLAWVLANPAESEARLRRLNELPVTLKRAAAKTQAERLLALKKWVERWLENPFRDEAFASLNEMQKTLVQSGAPPIR
jgi:hypothetical protein